MADISLGLSDYAQQQDFERQQKIEELRDLQEKIARDAERNSVRSDTSAGNGSDSGSFMSGMSGQINPGTLGTFMKNGSWSMGSGASGGGAASGGAAGGGGSGGGFGLGSLFGGGSAASGSAAGAGGAGSSAASGAAAAGPWAALAAIVMTNEYNAKKGGYRSGDDKQYAKDLIGGSVLEQDLNQRWLPKIYGENLKNDKFGLGHDQGALGEFGSGDFKNGFKKLEDGTLGKAVKAIKKLF